MKLSYQGPASSKLVLEQRETEVLQAFVSFREDAMRITLEGHPPILVVLSTDAPELSRVVRRVVEQALRHEAQEFAAALEGARKAALPPSAIQRAKEWLLG